ncbi:apolipoprotein L6-like [Sorex araneus]|uniref:apolipoprotein L6-like n=1 Tax=Sorex araneus TaxID=42254 RepID=UPI0024334CF5|nr:apolipoprotein L6-like [Sorex araneus]
MSAHGTSWQPLDTQAGEEGKAGAGWQRDPEGLPAEVDPEAPGSPLSAEERRFLETFPLCEEELETGARRLRALADHVERTHRHLAGTHVAVQAVAVLSGALSLLGLLLAPATAAGSLLLSAAGRGLGTAAGVAGLLTDLWGHVHGRGARAQASSLVPAPGCEAPEARGWATPWVVAASQLVSNCRGALDELRKSVRALRVARARPRLVRAAGRLQASGQASARRSQRARRAFEDTPLAMSPHGRWLQSVLAGLSLGLDVGSLRDDWTQLQEGAGPGLAEALRARAGELEQRLAELSGRQEHLQVSRSGGR